MSVLYLECGSGINADLMLASLASLLDDPDEVADMLSSTGLPIAAVSVDRSEPQCTPGIRVRIETGEEKGHSHHGPKDIKSMIDSLKVSDMVKDDAKGVFDLLAGAEAKVHGESADTVHFHEVGSLENVSAVVGVCMMMERLSPDDVMSSRVCTGFGHVHCAHGVLPIPAPATAALLDGIPVYSGDVEGEFCTPTGAALLQHFVSSFGDMPSSYQRMGCGLSSKTNDPRMLRIFEIICQK